MKTKLLLLFVCLSSLNYAQLEQVVDASFGTFTPLLQYQGNLFVRQNVDNLDTQGYDYQYYKINVANNIATKLTITESAKPYFENGHWASVINNGPANPVFNPQYYGYNLYFRIQVGNQIIVKINTQNNVLDIIDPNEAQGIGVQLLNDRLYYGNSGNSNYPNGWINLPNETIVPSSNWFDVANSYTFGNNLFMSYKSEENNWYFANFDNLQYETALLPTDNTGRYLIPQGFYPKIKPFLTNNHLFYNFGYAGKIISYSVDNILDNNYDILDLSEYQLRDYIVLNDGAVFYTVHYDVETGIYSYKWYKTDGTNNAVEIDYMPALSDWGFLSYFQTYSDWNSFQPVSSGNSFLQIGNLTYFSTVDTTTGIGGDYSAKIYKMSSINSIPELIFAMPTPDSNYSVKYATEWQGNLIFYNEQEKIIYTYNGTELYIDPQLNTFNTGGRTIKQENVEITGIFTDENYILVNTAEDGLFKIEQKILTTTEQEESKIKIYPNPVSENLYFSEKLSDIQIFDISGKNISSIKGNRTELNVENLSNGNYILKGKTEAGKPVSLKFIKK